jgi:aspartate/methionine/tyrosine aminotransferase
MRREDYSRVKLMWINYPHMPTGTPANAEVLQQLLHLARERQFLLCHDNPYSLVLNSDRPFSIFSLAGAKEVCLELNSLSKSHNMAGWRVGWISGAAEYLREIIKIKSNVDSGMFRGIQDAAVQALQNPEAWHEARNREYAERREIVFRLMDRLGCRYNKAQEGMFVWARIPEHAPSAEKFVDSILQENHVFLTPGFIFGAKGERYIRASLCNPKNILEEAFNRIFNF